MSDQESPANGLPAQRGVRYIGQAEDVWDKHSVIQTYYRTKMSDRRDYIDTLSIDKREKLEADERRIFRTKANLMKNARKRKLFQEMKASFQDWATQVANDPDRPNFNEDRDNFLYHLTDQSQQNTIGEDDAGDPAQNFHAGIMHFKRSSSEQGSVWRGASDFPDKYQVPQDYYGKADFPHRKISVHKMLHDTSHNPFQPVYDSNKEQLLKYIHFPANHMEVSLAYFTAHDG